MQSWNKSKFSIGQLKEQSFEGRFYHITDLLDTDNWTTILYYRPKIAQFFFFFFLISDVNYIQIIKKNHPSIHDVYGWGS